MRSIAIDIHYIAEPDIDQKKDPIIPKNELIEFFRAFNIKLKFSKGEKITDDPANEGFGVKCYQELSQEFWPNDPINWDTGPFPKGHLIVGRTHWRNDSQINGALVDTRKRGTAAIFTRSDYLNSGNQSHLLQVCIHEIGHMLNLTHDESSCDYPSAMRQVRDVGCGPRKGNISQAWDKAESNLGSDDFLSRPSPLMEAYPFSLQSRTWLQHQTNEEVLPGGNNFRNSISDRFDRSETWADVQLIPQDQLPAVGEGIGLELELKNRGTKKHRVPANLSPGNNTVWIRITRPNGLRYIHKPRIFVCRENYIYLSPGKTLHFSFYILDGPGGSAFPLSGRYVFEAFIPKIRCVSPPLKINVAKQKTAILTDNSFSRFLSNGAPIRQVQKIKQLKFLIRQMASSKSAFRSRLALMLARRSKNSYEINDLLNIAEDKIAPRAIRHAAILQRAKWLMMDTSMESTKKRETFKKICFHGFGVCSDEIKDKPLFQSLKNYKSQMRKSL